MAGSKKESAMPAEVGATKFDRVLMVIPCSGFSMNSDEGFTPS